MAQRQWARYPQEMQCKECGAYLENTAGGNYSICPKGHGKLMPKMTLLEQRIIRIVEDMTQAGSVVRPATWIRGNDYSVNGKTMTKAKRMDVAKVVAFVDGKEEIPRGCVVVRVAETLDFLLLKEKE